MTNFRKLIAAAAVTSLGALLLLLPAAQTQTPQAATNEPVPAFHAQPPTDALPPTMEPSLFQDVMTFNSYAVASRIKKVLYQEPCYCHCDQHSGHGSLLDCFVSRHASGCGTCMKEAFYAYEQTHKGKTPAQIRDGIIKGDWGKVDTAKYSKDYLPPVNK